MQETFQRRLKAAWNVVLLACCIVIDCTLLYYCIISKFVSTELSHRLFC